MYFDRRRKYLQLRLGVARWAVAFDPPIARSQRNAVRQSHDRGRNAIQSRLDVVLGFHGIGQDVLDPGAIIGHNFRAGVFQKKCSALAYDIGESGTFRDRFGRARCKHP